MKRVLTSNHQAHALLLALVFLFTSVSYSQTTFSWRNDQNPTNGQWNVANNWWNGSMGALPGGGEILFLDGNIGTTMTNDLSATNRHKITFGSTNTPASRTINGSSENTFFEFGSTWPWIKNQAIVTHTVNFPLKASNTSGINLELIAESGSLILSNTVNNNSRRIQIYGNNSSIDVTGRFIRISGVLSGAGDLNVSQFGTVKLNAAHSYTGQTQIDNGELWVESSGSMTSSSGIFVGNGGQTTNTAKLWLSNTTGGTTLSNNITVNAGNYQKRYLGGLNTSGTHTYSGTITNNAGNVSLSALSTGGITEFTNTISGSGQVNIEGSGTTILSGTNNYTGLTYVTGKLKLTGASTSLSTSSGITVDAGGNLQVSSNQTINSLSLINGDVTVDNGVTLTINGTLTLTSGKVTLNGTGNIIATSTITGGSSTSYIVTGGTGTLKRTSVTSATFPIGTATSYNPLSISSGGSVDYAVKVNSTAPTGTGIAQPTKVISRQWDITPTGSPMNVGLSFQYNSGEGVSGGTFSNTGSMDGIHYNSTLSKWEYVGTATATGSGPYTVAFTYAGPTWSPFSFGNAGILTTELQSFEANSKGNSNLLDWTTAAEKDNATFNIQRSSNNQAWQTIGSVKATNNANGSKYNFTDDAPLSIINYYRLQMVDVNGKMDYSKVVSVSGKDGKQTLSVYPNPVKAELTLLTKGDTEGVAIYDMTGKMVRQINDNRPTVNVQDLPNGIYFARLLSKNGVLGEAARFVKQ